MEKRDLSIEHHQSTSRPLVPTRPGDRRARAYRLSGVSVAWGWHDWWFCCFVQTPTSINASKNQTQKYRGPYSIKSSAEKCTIPWYIVVPSICLAVHRCLTLFCLLFDPGYEVASILNEMSSWSELDLMFFSTLIIRQEFFKLLSILKCNIFISNQLFSNLDHF